MCAINSSIGLDENSVFIQTETDTFSGEAIIVGSLKTLDKKTI